MEKEYSFQQALEQLDIHRQKSKSQPTPHTLYKVKMDHRNIVIYFSFF